MGICRPTVACAVSYASEPRAVRRFCCGQCAVPCPGKFRECSVDRHDRSRTGRQELCAFSERASRGDRSDVLVERRLFTTNFMEPLFWMGCAYFAILAIKRNDPRYWVWFGVVAGLGLNNNILDHGFRTGNRHRPCALRSTADLVEQVAVAGRAGGFPDFSAQPHLDVEHHWPFVELMRNIRAEGRDVQLSAWQFFSQQTLLIGTLSAPSG